MTIIVPVLGASQMQHDDNHCACTWYKPDADRPSRRATRQVQSAAAVHDMGRAIGRVEYYFAIEAVGSDCVPAPLDLRQHVFQTRVVLGCCMLMNAVRAPAGLEHDSCNAMREQHHEATCIYLQLHHLHPLQLQEVEA